MVKKISNVIDSNQIRIKIIQIMIWITFGSNGWNSFKPKISE